jgi:hypothetical protein
MGHKPHMNAAALSELLHPRQHIADRCCLAVTPIQFDVVVWIDEQPTHTHPCHRSLGPFDNRADVRRLTALVGQEDEVVVDPLICLFKLLIADLVVAIEESFVGVDFNQPADVNFR